MEDIFPLSVGQIISGYRHSFMMVIKLIGVQFGLKSCAWFQNRTHAACSFDLKSQVWFQTKIARHEVQLPLYYIPFEIQDLVSSNILLMQHWAGLKLNLSILRGGDRSFGNKSCKICHIIHCLLFSCNLIGYFKQALKSDWLFYFSVASSLAKKKMRFKAKSGAIRE